MLAAITWTVDLFSCHEGWLFGLRTERERSNQSHRRQHDFMQGWIFHSRPVESKFRSGVKTFFDIWQTK